MPTDASTFCVARQYRCSVSTSTPSLSQKMASTDIVPSKIRNHEEHEDHKEVVPGEIWPCSLCALCGSTMVRQLFTGFRGRPLHRCEIRLEAVRVTGSRRAVRPA